jgi:hypothetical protein
MTTGMEKAAERRDPAAFSLSAPSAFGSGNPPAGDQGSGRRSEK